MDFGKALNILKKGGKMTREGWNGKGQYIELAFEIAYHTFSDLDSYTAVRHEDIGSTCIVFVGTRGRQMGWLASQADMLATDWYEVKNG